MSSELPLKPDWLLRVAAPLGVVVLAGIFILLASSEVLYVAVPLLTVALIANGVYLHVSCHWAHEEPPHLLLFLRVGFGVNVLLACHYLQLCAEFAPRA